ncbi:CAP domain-containing protein [Mycolicibacterium celeriflavum]|uniref:CAP domain-containing protein n=1 Tax=Mycolicibacterium celeriflavum TaxID=1249101 RepID=UPI0009F1EB89|nr:CAP domain-containing protein [Mycolicibacterium celeriflavum]MCV7241129.1 CAP domain-containing protein [Mycolicibacterium celeriflavum]ORA45035.1 secretion protein [Mycolicibacterium celeriflavum]
MSLARTSTLTTLCAAAVTLFSPLLAVPAHADEGGALLNQINATRAANGCGPVAANPQLSAAASRQANDMLANGVVNHTGSDGSSVVKRITDAGYTSYSNVGEIIFWSTGVGNVPPAAVNWWMNSPGHRAIITDCGMTEAGFSVLRNGNRAAAVGEFGRK